ncbi:MAG: hypothetical protein H6996_07895 [Moraxellaceae bacterium]|nr:hypothetical protein [Moraxellaceae bacterium]
MLLYYFDADGIAVVAAEVDGTSILIKLKSWSGLELMNESTMTIQLGNESPGMIKG